MFSKEVIPMGEIKWERDFSEAIEKARERIRKGKFLSEAEAKKRLGL